MYSDALRDRVSFQTRGLSVSGTGFGQSNTWSDRVSIPARLRTLSSRELRAYERGGYVNVQRIEADDRIRKTSNKSWGGTSLREYLQSSSLDEFRIIHRGRTLNVIGVVKPTEGLHDTAGHHVWIDCIETPIPTGEKDA
jgi:head-tail adaptor